MTTWAAELKATAPEVEPEAEPLPDAEAAARELSKLLPLAYAQCRKAESERLGVTLGALDAAVRGYRANSTPPDVSTVEVVEVAGRVID